MEMLALTSSPIFFHSGSSHESQNKGSSSFVCPSLPHQPWAGCHRCFSFGGAPNLKLSSTFSSRQIVCISTR